MPAITWPSTIRRRSAWRRARACFSPPPSRAPRRIRLGPLVYVLPLYHPLRLYEEICMLDHLSGGRLMVGVGRGGALIEHQRYGVDPTDAPAMYHEAFAVLMRAFASDVLDFEGKFYHYKDYRRAGQAGAAPAPADLVRRAQCRGDRLGGAARGQRGLARAGGTRARHRRPLPRGMDGARRDAAALPKIGITRHIVVADNRRARRSASRAPPIRAGAGHGLAVAALRRSISCSRKSTRRISPRWTAIGHGVAGSPATRARLSRAA